ncbi:THAP-type domain-containing protein [Aphis craccivora]|uniref:THAP-type domain-containing protein n=1 Tax=Aphis craccivora TaxID=307492 RepID=A0A6G0VNI2_APHCR|nr:THAP-type domain-containing protein [Aphis craccivora]
MKCCVPNCTAGKEKSTFGVPKNENLKNQWKDILGIFLKSKFRVCAAHFHETDIIKTWVSGQGLSKYSRSRWMAEGWRKRPLVVLPTPPPRLVGSIAQIGT